MLTKIRNFLQKERQTKGCLNLFGINLKKTIKYRYKDITEDVFIDSSKDSTYGWVTPTNKIVLGNDIFKKFSKNVQDYTFLHEYGHFSLSTIPKILLYIVLLISFIILLFSTIMVIIFPIVLLLGNLSIQNLLQYIFQSIFVFFVALTMTIIFSWSSELYAELFAIKKMGKRNYFRAMKEIERKRINNGIIRKIIHNTVQNIIFPPKRVILYFVYK